MRKKKQKNEKDESKQSRLSPSDSRTSPFACTEASVSYRYISRLKSLQVKFPLGLGGEKSHHSFAPSRTPRWLQFKVEAFPQNMENDQETT